MKRRWREECMTEITSLDDAGTVLDGWIEDFRVKVDTDVNPANLEVRTSFETVSVRRFGGERVRGVLIMNTEIMYEEDDA